MRKAFTMIEMVFVVVMLGVMAAVSVMYIPQTKLQQAADHMIHNIKYTKSLAQTDDRFFAMKDGSINNYSDTQAQHWKAGMWQVQFHLNGNTTKHSYSIYADTARNANTTNFDGRPMSGDLIAKDPQNKACLSGYSENNLPSECKDNIAKEVRLQETYDVTIDNIELPDACKETNTARIYFDNTGMPYCGAVNISSGNTNLPKRLNESMKITLKRQKQTATICVSKSGLIYGSNDGQCNK